MTTQNGPVSATTQTTGPESNTAAKQPSLTSQGTGDDPWPASLRAQLLGLPFPGGAPAALVLATIPRALWTEVIVACPGCGRPHRHHVGHDEARPLTRRVRCGDGQATTYVIGLDGAR